MSSNTYFVPKKKVIQCFIFGKRRCALLCWADCLVFFRRMFWWCSQVYWTILILLFTFVWCYFDVPLSEFPVVLRFRRCICSPSHSMQFWVSYCVPDLVLVTRLRRVFCESKMVYFLPTLRIFSDIDISRMACLIPGGCNPSLLTVFRYFLMASLYPQFTRSFRILVTSAWSASLVLHVVIAPDCRWFEVELRYCPAYVDFLLT